MNYKLPRQLRLIEKSQFERVFDKKQKLSAKFFTIYYCNNSFTYPRLGIGVSKKNVQKASQRNCFKRIIKEEFRLKQHSLKNKDLLVFVNSKAKDLDKKEARVYLDQQIEKLL